MIGTGRRTAALALSFLGLMAAACSEPETPVVADTSAELSAALAFRDGDPTMTIVSPADGEIVTSPVYIEVETENFDLGPAGQTRDGRGHLHILVDQDCRVPGVVIADDAENPHGALGQRRVPVDLEPGYHRLCVQVTDGFHVAVAIWQEIELEVVPNLRVETATQ